MIFKSFADYLCGLISRNYFIAYPTKLITIAIKEITKLNNNYITYIDNINFRS